MTKEWFKLFCKRKELQLLGTLNGGQSFRWKILDENEKPQKWIGVFANKVWILQQNDNHILYQVYEKNADEQQSKNDQQYYNNLLIDYFQLKLNLGQCYSEWSKKDDYFKIAASQFYGIRILNQELIENIFSFICSSNNNITRITGMVEKLAKFFGEKICEINNQTYYTFPNIESLSKSNVEDILKKQGFGYRAKYINKSAQFILENGNEKWLENLKKQTYENAKIQLLNLTGVGPKVADCICLMSLGHLQTIPVDTHVYQIARNFYLPKLPKQKTVTSKVYNEIGDYFRKLYGPLAGWAHTVLFCADLKKFQKDKSEKEPS